MLSLLLFFFFNDTATTEIYTLSLHDALPIFFPVLWGIWVFHKVRSELARAEELAVRLLGVARVSGDPSLIVQAHQSIDRKSTRLNSSHANISYAVFCLKKKIKQKTPTTTRST